MSEAKDAEEAVKRVRSWAAIHSREIASDVEVVNGIFNIIMEAPIAVTADCVAAVPLSLRPSLLELVRSAVKNDDYRHWVLYVKGWCDLGLDVDQQSELFKQREPHYRLVCERLLASLANANQT